MVRFKRVLTPTHRGGGGTLVPIPKKVAATLGLKGMPKVNAVIVGISPDKTEAQAKFAVKQ